MQGGLPFEVRQDEVPRGAARQVGGVIFLFNEALGNGPIDTETMKKIQERRAHLQALFARLLLSV